VAKERSEASPYPSKYAPGAWVSAAQRLAELMCERQALSKKQALPLRFWQLPHWEAEYRKQLRFANALFKLFRPAAVGVALRTPRGRKVYSLGATWFDDAVRAADERLAREEAALREIQEAARANPPPPAAGPAPQTRPAFTGGKSTANKLKGL
jgi:hypothetical protein